MGRPSPRRRRAAPACERISSSTSAGSSSSSVSSTKCGQPARGRGRRRGVAAGRYASTNEDGQRRRRAHERRQQVTRERVDPVTVLEHDHDDLLGRARAAGTPRASPRATSCAASRRSCAVRSFSGIGIPSTAEERQALDERRGRSSVAPARARGVAPHRSAARRRARSVRQISLPDEVVGVRAERRALAECDEAAAGADAADELGDQPRLAEARLGGDADGVAARLRSCGRARRTRAASSVRRPTIVELVTPAAPRDVVAAAGERVDGDRARPCPSAGAAASDSQANESPASPSAKLADVDAARRRLRHQPRRQVDASPRQTNVRRIAWP